MSEDYYKGKYDEMKYLTESLREELSKWKVAFGWSLAGLILGLFIAILK